MVAMSFRRVIVLTLMSLVCFAGRAAAGPTLLYDPANDKVLYAQEPDRLWHPASVTKIMTAYVTFDAIKAGQLTLQTKIPYSKLAQKMPASKIGLAVGSEVTVDFYAVFPSQECVYRASETIPTDADGVGSSSFATAAAEPGQYFVFSRSVEGRVCSLGRSNFTVS